MTREPSWPDSDSSGVTIEWVEANGLTFEVAQAGEGDHLALLMHGFPELHYSWRYQIPLLVGMGYRVWAPNMRGYGGTSRPEAISDYALDKLVADVAALIDASGAKKVTLFCHDWGGIVSWHFAIKKVRPIERFVVCNIPHPLGLIGRRRSLSQLRKSWYVFFFQIPWLPEALFSANRARRIGALFQNTSCNPENFGSDVRDVYRNAAARPGAMRAMIHYYRALLRTGQFQKVGDGRVDVPTLMIWGEQDVALDVEGTEGTEQWVPDFTLKRLPNASHWVQQDAPEEVNAILKEWLPGA
ncbi:MAG: alpha/beta fold hydrolase [Pseudomonadota bacterium]